MLRRWQAGTKCDCVATFYTYCCLMTTLNNDAALGPVLVRLADNFVSGFDLIDLLTTLVEETKLVLDTDEAGLLLLDEAGHLQVAASTSEAVHLMETMQLSGNAGPGLHAFQSKMALSVDDLRVDPAQWGEFADLAENQGFRSVHAIPLRLRAETIGVMNLFGQRPGPLSESDVAAGQTLADMATIAIIANRNLTDEQLVREQLQLALTSRVQIEQAKGILAHTHNLSMTDAFGVLRGYARAHSVGLNAVARQVVDRTLEL
jgi:GAF domain-containing protein